MIAFAKETFEQLAPDIEPLLEEHWAELALWRDDIPLKADFPGYKRAYDAGMMRFYTVREDGALIGYALFVVVPRNLHYDHRWARDDIIWIHPDARNFGVGTGLFEFFEADLAVDGPVVIMIETKAQHPALAALCQVRGYEDVGRLFGKRFA